MFSYQIDEDLRLELPEMRYAVEVAGVVRKNLAHLKPWMPWAVEDYSEDHARQWIERSREEYARDRNFNAVIFYKNQIAGTVGFHDLDPVNRHAAIGYWIDKDYEGKGITSRCCRVLIGYLFDTMEFNRVQLNCNIENTRSRAVAERLGFRLEGTLREIEYLNGRYGDWAVYGLLRDEWKSTANR